MNGGILPYLMQLFRVSMTLTVLHVNKCNPYSIWVGGDITKWLNLIMFFTFPLECCFFNTMHWVIITIFFSHIDFNITYVWQLLKYWNTTYIFFNKFPNWENKIWLKSAVLYVPIKNLCISLDTNSILFILSVNG